MFPIIWSLVALFRLRCKDISELGHTEVEDSYRKKEEHEMDEQKRGHEVKSEDEKRPEESGEKSEDVPEPKAEEKY